MGSFRIDPKGSLEHDLRKIDRQEVPKILEAIESLSENPFPVQSRKMKGSESSYRLRIGDYRLIYQVDTENKIVTIYHARHRKDVCAEGKTVTDLPGFSGIGHSIEDCLYKAKWGMIEHVGLLREQGLPVPPRNPNPKIVIQNEETLIAA